MFKKSLLFVVLLSMLSFSYNSDGQQIVSCGRYVETTQSSVYICTGNYAKVYHKYRNCKGIKACKKSIEKVSEQEAKSIGRRKCKICY